MYKSQKSQNSNQASANCRRERTESNRKAIRPLPLVIFRVNYPFLVWDCPQLCKSIIGQKSSDFGREQMIEWFGNPPFHFETVICDDMKEVQTIYKTINASVNVHETIDRKGWREMRISHPQLKRRFLAKRSDGGTLYAKVKAEIEKQFGELLYVITISSSGLP